MVSKTISPQSAGQVSEQSLQEQVALLPAELSPERDLWSGIEKAISVQEQGKRKKAINNQWSKAPVAWAASVVAAVLLTWGIYSPQGLLPNSEQASANLVAAMQQTFNQHKKTILVSFGQPKLQALPVEIQEQFKQLTSAQLTIRKALESEPNNIDLLNLLRWTQQQEIDLLNKLYSPQWQSI